MDILWYAMTNLKAYLMGVTKEPTPWCSLGWAVLCFVRQAAVNRTQEQPVEPTTFQSSAQIKQISHTSSMNIMKASIIPNSCVVDCLHVL